MLEEGSHDLKVLAMYNSDKTIFLVENHHKYITIEEHKVKYPFEGTVLVLRIGGALRLTSAVTTLSF